MNLEVTETVRALSPMVIALVLSLLVCAQSWHVAGARLDQPVTDALALTCMLLGVGLVPMLLTASGTVPLPAPADPVVVSTGVIAGALVPLTGWRSRRDLPSVAVLAISMQLAGPSVAIIASELFRLLPDVVVLAALIVPTAAVLTLAVDVCRTLLTAATLASDARTVTAGALVGLTSTWMLQAHLLRRGAVSLSVATVALACGVLLLAAALHLRVQARMLDAVASATSTSAPSPGHADPATSRLDVPDPQPASDVMHEARSIAAGITSAADALTELRGECDLLSMISAESRRLQRLLLESHDETAEPDRSPPSATPRHRVDLDEVLEVLATAHRARGLDVRWRPTRHTLETGHPAARDLVAQVLNTLLDNVHHHAGAAPVSLTVRRTPDALVSIRVEDRGPGIESGLLGRLYQPGARSSTSQGTGRGLHSARRIARTLGGDLVLEDSSDRGTAFELRLPSASAGTVLS